MSLLEKTNILISHFSSSKQSISVPNLEMLKKSFGIMLSTYLCTPTSLHQSEDMQMWWCIAYFVPVLATHLNPTGNQIMCRRKHRLTKCFVSTLNCSTTEYFSHHHLIRTRSTVQTLPDIYKKKWQCIYKILFWKLLQTLISEVHFLRNLVSQSVTHLVFIFILWY